MSAKSLPSRPSLEFYRKEAKHLLKSCKAGEAAALQRIRDHHPHAPQVIVPKLADAQCVVAREYGFESWPKFVTHIERIVQTDIVTAAQRGDVDTARAMLRADPSLINSKDDEGHGLLYVTAMYGFNARIQSHRAFVEFLIEAGTEVDLHAAAFLARPDRVREILRSKPNVVNKSVPPYDCTALQYAAERGDLATVKALVENGADLNARDKFGRPPLAVAAHAGPWKPAPADDVIDYLLEKGAQLDVFGAASLGHAELLERLAAREPLALDNRDAGGCTALWHAARNNRMDAVRWLVEHGAPVNAQNADGQTALSTAILHLLPQQTDPDLIRYLLDHGADVDLRDERGKSQFFWAIIRRNFPFAELLLQYGADVNATWKDGLSLLHHEAKDGKAETVEFLLKHGANPNIRDNRGQPGSTPLHGATRQDRVAVAKLLIENGADVNAKTDAGETPLDAARASKKQKVLPLLRSATRDAPERT